jgi:hyperosmotically inducible periplasmic protein
MTEATSKEDDLMKSRSMLGLLAPALFVIACSQSDPGITTSVKTQLTTDELVKARNINVDTRDGVVTLTGTVQSAAEEAKALQIARSTKGVANVVDNIVIAPEPGAAPTTGTTGDTSIGAAASAAVTDAGITTKVKTSLLGDPDVGGLRIDVDTRDGVVTLTGTVSSSAEKARALDLAGKVDNVKRVEDKLTVSPRKP